MRSNTHFLAREGARKNLNGRGCLERAYTPGERMICLTSRSAIATL